MTIVLVALFIVLIFFGYLFFAPFYLEINSVEGWCRIRFHRLASVKASIRNNALMFEMKIAGWKKERDFNAMSNGANKKAITRKEERKKESGRKRKKISWKKIRSVLSSFKVNKCIISIDSGDVQLNGQLFPVFYLLSAYSKKDIRINFIEENIIVLEIKNSLARMSWAYISS